MKKLLISILMLLPFMVAAQKGYTLSGKIPELKEPAKAYLAFYKDAAWKETDSVEIKNGKFQFNGNVEEPQTVIIAIRRHEAKQSSKQSDYQSFIIENSKITIEGKDSIYNAKITGSLAEKENREREEMIKPITKQIIHLQNFYGKKNSAGVYEKSIEDRKKAGDSISKLVSKIKSINREFVENHLNSFAGLLTYTTHVLDSKFDPVDAEALLHRFSPELQSSPLGKNAQNKIEIGKRRQQGAKATDFTQNDVNGNPFTLSSLRGKYVLVDFWASWCLPCRAENPNVVKAYNALKGDKFEIVSVSLDAGKESWLNAIKTDGMPWIHVSDLKYWKNDVAVMYGISSVPQNLLIDPNGVIIAKNLRGEDLTDQLRKFIK
ncbi:AhpC/TSA family protein [Pedobacter chinensis]|uniref:AhpC/TSA family protein n=1 Tax=Pedobacter chinensis TaxID=2282421 RepID=A0A369PTQ7_9SPHI|nr:TlpA disulfide reductase family protein [Pedobacter chinensis]RDC55914.1 AhpC/TSA family protein [Pedobacter chinensis]